PLVRKWSCCRCDGDCTVTRSDRGDEQHRICRTTGSVEPARRSRNPCGGEEMTDPARVRRHAERVRELVASAVRTQIKDPRLGMITITDARITPDLRDATVYYTVLGDAAERA